jgi:hypothetical protein
VDAITIITGPRTGAGHLIALTQNLEAVAQRDGLFADGFADASGKIDIAELEARGEGKSLLIVKATSAMPREILERDLLSRPGMRAIIVVRRQIDAYVSLAKAAALGAWRDTDLSNVKVKLDAAHFASWLDAEEAWYAHWKGWLERRSFPVPVLRYETHINVPPESALRRLVSAAAQVGITIRVPLNLPHKGLVKQDREGAAAFRVKNWPDFSKSLIERGIEKRAFGYPI